MSRSDGTSTHRRGRSALAAATGIACAVALAAAPASAAVDGGSGTREGGLPRLRGSVGPGFVISINDDSVPAGRYKLIVRDKGTIHNFHITGAGVDKKTSIPNTGRKVFKITFTAGTYDIVCDAHSSMNTTLEVT